MNIFRLSRLHMMKDLRAGWETRERAAWCDETRRPTARKKSTGKRSVPRGTKRKNCVRDREITETDILFAAQFGIDNSNFLRTSQKVNSTWTRLPVVLRREIGVVNLTIGWHQFFGIGG
jgi:hypothetical protein